MGQRGPGARPVHPAKAPPPLPLLDPVAPLMALPAFRRDPPPPAAPEGRTRADRLINWIAGLSVPSGKLAGQPFKLRPWQRAIVKAVYATDRRGRRQVRTALLSMGRKNGKTGLTAALALAHLCGPEAIKGGQVLSGAADRAQAAIIYAAMKTMALARLDIANRLIFRDFKKEIEDIHTGSIYQALSSDHRKAHGTSPSFWIADEVAQWRGRDLLDALQTGSGAHAEPLGFIISTRSPDPNNPLEELIRYAADIEAGALTDPTFRAFIYSAPLDADPWSDATWRAANPALGDFRDLADVQIQAERARRIPSLEASFRAYTLNQPVAPDTRWIAPADWDACAAEPAPAGPCWGGLDLASGAADLSSFALFWPDTGAVRCWAFLPAEMLATKEREDGAPYAVWKAMGHVILTPGRTVDRAWLAQWIALQTDGLELQAIASDRWLIDDLRAQMAREGVNLPLEPHGAGFKDVSPSLTAAEALILQARLAHGGNPLLRWAMANAAIEMDPAGNRKLSKRRARGRIDPAVAMVTAIGLASRRLAPIDLTNAVTVFEF